MAPPRRKNIFRLAPPPPATIYVRSGFLRRLTEEFAALKVKRAALVEDKVEAHSQGDLRENFGFKAAKDAIRAVDRKMDDLDRFYRRNTFIEVDPAAWLVKPTDFVQLGHVVRVEKAMSAASGRIVSPFWLRPTVRRRPIRRAGSSACRTIRRWPWCCSGSPSVNQRRSDCPPALRFSPCWRSAIRPRPSSTACSRRSSRRRSRERSNSVGARLARARAEPRARRF
jgi:transcription elongation GreA/GreB family factor